MNRALSTAFGLMMVASAAFQAGDNALIVAGLAALTVLVGMAFRPAATLAVVLTAAVLVLTDAPAAVAAMSGLCAACYLVLRHTATITAPTVVGAVGFTAVGLAAATLPLELPWVPLAAPVVVLTLVVLTTRPFWVERSSTVV